MKNLQEAQRRMRERQADPMEEIVWKLTYSERRVFNLLKAKGFNEIIRKGWPDFMVVTNKGLVGVEVKHRKDKLESDQKRTHKILNRMGIPTLVVFGDDDLSAIEDTLRKKISL